MAGKDRARRLARERYERRMRRRAERQRRRRRVAAISAAVVLVVLMGAGTVVAARTGGQAKPPRAAASTSPVAPSPTTASTCNYLPVSADLKKYVKDVGRPPAEPDTTHSYRADIATNRGHIVVALDSRRAACAVNSLRYLAGHGFYNGTRCHRLTTTATAGFGVLQCGDPTGTGMGGPGYRFANENTAGATYPRGTVAMAHSSQPDSNGSQFFIVYQAGSLPPDYTVVGTVVKGLDIVDKVAADGVAADGVAPKDEVVIDDLTVTRHS